MEQKKRRLIQLGAGFVAGAALVAFAAVALGAPERLKDGLDIVRSSGAPVFFIAMAVLPLVGFPLAPFIFSAGPLFGPTLGLPAVIGCAIAAVAANVIVAYAIAVRALRPSLERLVRWLGYPVPDLKRADSWEFTMLVRLVPGVPFFVQSYLLGLARVRFPIYLGFSIGIPAGYICAAVLTGDALVRGNRTEMLAGGLAFAVVGLVLHVARKRFAARRAARAADPAAPAAGRKYP